MHITKQRLVRLAKKMNGFDYRENLLCINQEQVARIARSVMRQLICGYEHEETRDAALRLLNGLSTKEKGFLNDSYLLSEIKQFLKDYEHNKK